MITIAVAQADGDSSESDREKCYGVAKAGDNDCAGFDSHGEKQGCPGWTTQDNDPYAWSYVPKGTCKGSLHPPPRVKSKDKD
ncbi:MAG: DUF2282 domain-containing protein [Alphaproteobacteria bacterium]|nr:DUF2282 domain-containing protein [Alphaproteobacteria bacterium]